MPGTLLSDPLSPLSGTTATSYGEIDGREEFDLSICEVRIHVPTVVTNISRVDIVMQISYERNYKYTWFLHVVRIVGYGSVYL